MPTTETLPEIDRCVDLFLRIHDFYGEDTFGPDELSQRLGDCDDETRLPAETHSLTRLLNLLTAYGLLDRRIDGHYQVRCVPDEEVDRWRARAVTRVDTLYQRVRGTATSSEDERTDGPGPETIRHDGEPFVSVFLRDAADFDAARTTVRNAMEDYPDYAGVVLRSPAELAAKVQRFADELCDPAATPDENRRFEKVTTDLVGADKDDLEFRLFLCETA